VWEGTSGWGASAHHDGLVVRKALGRDPIKREEIVPLAFDPERLEEPVKPDEVHGLHVGPVASIRMRNQHRSKTESRKTGLGRI